VVTAASPSFSLETANLIHSLRFFARILLIGGVTTLAMTAGSLLHSELVRAWASELRRMVKRNPT
jgi:hypothetical protein